MLTFFFKSEKYLYNWDINTFSWMRRRGDKLGVSTAPKAAKKTTLNIIKTKDTHSTASIIIVTLLQP